MKKPRERFFLFQCGFICILLTLCVGLGGISAVNRVYADEEMPAEARAAAVETASDALTVENWNTTTDSDTQNLGRIWTDKSVTSSIVTFSNTDQAGQAITEAVDPNKNEDFLASLSLLSSYANIKGTVTIAKPLDVVMVLDTSGSMTHSITDRIDYVKTNLHATSTYNDLSNKMRRENLYYQDPETGEYHLIHKELVSAGFLKFNYTFSYMKNGKKVIIAENVKGEQLGANADCIYVSRELSRTTKMDALKKAAKKFVDGMAATNINISDPAKRDRVSLVTFSSDAYRLLGFTDDSLVLKSKIDSLSADGATCSDLGLERANEEIKRNSRADAKKVVIFFTDGVPTSHSEFNDTVANGAIRTSKSMKDAGVDVYAIGVFDGADPEDVTSNFNAYMNGVSSNYPSAMSYTNLGTRVDKGDYYMAARDSQSLNDIFDAIQQQITHSEAQYPTTQQDGLNPDKTGYVTFTDTLGKYMQVSDMHSVVIGNTKYVEHTVVDNQDGTVTYSFTGKGAGNDLDTNHRSDLKDILITVTKGVFDGDTSDQVHGDVIEVKVPSSMIPLRGYEVNIVDGKVTTVVKTENPMHISYGIKTVDTLDAKMENPDGAMKDYMSNNLSLNGNLSFYANDFVRNGDSCEANVFADFSPAKTNSFYYFTTDVPIYADNTFATPVTGALDENATYYYKNTYYTEGQSLDPSVEALPIYGGDIRTFVKTNENGELVIKSGSPNNTTLTRYEMAKGNGNLTNTASYVTKPTWQPQQDGTYNVRVFLGNNGRLEKEMPFVKIPVHVQTALVGRTPDRVDDFTVTANLKDHGQAAQITIPGPLTMTVHGTSDVVNADMGMIEIKEAGTYEIEIVQTKGTAGNIDYDPHLSVMTIVVSRDPTSQNLILDSVTYNNIDAWNAADAVLTDKAAFTNYLSGSFTFTKFGDKNGSNKEDAPLAGAQFTLYELECQDTAHDHSVEEVKVTRGGNTVVDTPDDCWKLVGTVTSVADGVVTFDHLHTTSKYRLVETAQPNGYLTPIGQWNIAYDADPNHPEMMIFQPTNSVGNPPAFKVIQNTDGSTGFQVKNYKWYDMPVSGDSGISKYLSVGACLMAAGTLFFIVMNRKHKKA